MKVLHAAATISHSSGIANQMQWEQDAAIAMGLSWHCEYWTLDTLRRSRSNTTLTNSEHSSSESKSLKTWLALRFRYTKRLFRVVRMYDLVLLRHSIHDPFQALFLFVFGRKCVLVHHAIEHRELVSLGWPSRSARNASERFLGFVSLQLVAGVIGVTNEITQYQVERSRQKDIWSSTYPNGIISDFVPVADERSDVPTFLFVASTFLPWQGLDLLLDSAKSSKHEFIVHVVGEVPSSLRDQVAQDNRFVLHGLRQSRDIATLAGRSHLGVSSLALDRMGLTEACALKVRQYLAWGLPVVGSYDETFSSDFPYYMKISPDIEELFLVANRFRLTSRTEIATTARPEVDKRTRVESLWLELQHLR